ncbi:MAG: ABC transporter permease, partial [Lentisphaeria bacterium]|nr:ABC transporter permease [Lentisphaeria bacterium]
IMAAGMTYIIITGGIDLSVGSMLAMCGMIGAASMLYFSGGTWADISSGSYIHLSLVAMIAGTLISVLAGAVCGFTNGMLITKLKLAPFIVTLGTMSIFRGISYIMNAGKPFAVSDYSWLDTGRVGGIPSSVILLVLVMVAFWFLLKHTRFGRYTYAIGSNTQTAFHAGINVNKTLVWIYTLTGALVGLASMITVSRASTAQPTAGISLELDIIAACIIGGCAPSGGRGTMMGTVIGTLLISFLRNGLTLLDISTNVQLVVIGLIIIVAVTADQIATRRKAT